MSDRRLIRTARRGFTLMEIIVVVTIIAILAGLIMPRLLGRVTDARRSAAAQGASNIKAQVRLYELDTGNAIDSSFDLEALLLTPDNGGGSSGPYLDSAEDLIDPWGNRYQIHVPGTKNHDFDIVSYANDGQVGGEGDDEDIVE